MEGLHGSMASLGKTGRLFDTSPWDPVVVAAPVGRCRPVFALDGDLMHTGLRVHRPDKRARGGRFPGRIEAVQMPRPSVRGHRLSLDAHVPSIPLSLLNSRHLTPRPPQSRRNSPLSDCRWDVLGAHSPCHSKFPHPSSLRLCPSDLVATRDRFVRLRPPPSSATILRSGNAWSRPPAHRGQQRGPISGRATLRERERPEGIVAVSLPPLYLLQAGRSLPRGLVSRASQYQGGSAMSPQSLVYRHLTIRPPNRHECCCIHTPAGPIH